MMVRLMAALAAVLVVLASGVQPLSSPAAFAQPATPESSPITVEPGRLIVVLKETTSASATFSAAASYERRSDATITHRYTNLVRGFAGQFDQSAIDALLKDPNVASIRPDIAVPPAEQVLPTGTNRIDADKNATKAGNGSGAVAVDVAVFDTGVIKHADLNVVGGKDCALNGSPYSDVYGHGTPVAGIIGAKDNGIGTVGVAPGARIWALKVTNDTDGLAYASNVICAQEFVAATPQIRIINYSFAGPDYGFKETCFDGLTRQGFCELEKLGVTTFVAAGNASVSANNYAPSAWPEVITVSAYEDHDGKPGRLAGGFDDTFASFSNYGSVVDIAAPGAVIRSTSGRDPSGYENFHGTSAASPHAAGAAALLLAQRGISGKAATLDRLLKSAEEGPIPGDPDSSKEPLINVASFGSGRMVIPETARPGDVVDVRLGGMAPGSRVIFRYEGTYIGGDTVDANGRANRKFTVPASAKGPHQITAKNEFETLAKPITIGPAIWASPSSVVVGDSIKVTMKGLGSRESVRVTFDGRAMGTITASSSGTATLTFTVPATAGGSKTVRATGSTGSSLSKIVSVNASGVLTNGPVGPSVPAQITLRGFGKSEVVSFRWDAPDGAELGSKTMSTTGSGSATVTLPADSGGAEHTIYAVGNAGHTVAVPLGLTSADDPTPTPSPTVEATATPAPVEPTVSASPEPTDEPTSTATPEPTATDAPPTETPLPTGTATPTAGVGEIATP